MTVARWKRRAPWLVLPVAVLAAFVAGTCAAGDHRADEHTHAEHDPDGDDATTWTCAMHPQIRQPEPGQCPICGMDLIPAEDVEEADPEDVDPARVTLSERARSLARLRTVPVRRLAEHATERRLLGRVDYDETTLQTVTAWVGGRIDRLHVATTGQRVRSGQVIATLYSPELYQAHQDLLQAKRQAARAADAPAAVAATAQRALQATRERLRLLGVPGSQIQRLEEAEEPLRQARIRTPFRGTIIERLATEGQYVETGTPLYRIADLRRLWVQLDAYESDLPLLSVGQQVTLTARALPGEELEGRVAFVDPVVDAQRRTARVRIEVDNQDRRLRPGMFAEAHVRAEPAAAEDAPLVIPRSAALFTGERSLVYVEVPDTEGPTYEARDVLLGPRVNDTYPVLAGLREGERVVYRGAFVLDADLQIRGGTSMMTRPDDTQPGPFDEAIPLSAEQRTELRPALVAYLDAQEALAEDDLQAARDAAAALGAATETDPDLPHRAAAAWRPLGRAIHQHAGRVADAPSSDAARAAFEQLTEPVKAMLRRFGNPLDSPVHLAFCPMAFDDRGATWLQRHTRIANPYFGEAMHACGEILETLAPGAHLPAATDPAPAAPPEGHVH